MDEWKRSNELLDFGTTASLTDSSNDDDVAQWLTRVGW
jgi:hypothetical protein